eukprot:CAMPEP_0175297274 /NCGR_PEP_ID=MMETSP0093-20121207/59475_1 /TAXON_ID=311494 /ORGANISM="Alexandrium monilatum, Strain CCMP3105" /LENGTH=122 /DNA_ID=CAMNT_0016593327 /DNA_START=37 /DNA_END=403 /DNA_ORIENTATION=+
MFGLSAAQRGQTTLGWYDGRTWTETVGPGTYDPHAFLNPAVQRMTRARYVPDRAPGYVSAADGASQKWRPEPFSLSRSQSEQPLVHMPRRQAGCTEEKLLFEQGQSRFKGPEGKPHSPAARE